MDDSRANMPANRRVNFGQASILFLLTALNLVGDRGRTHIGILHSALSPSSSSLLF